MTKLILALSAFIVAVAVVITSLGYYTKQTSEAYAIRTQVDLQMFMFELQLKLAEPKGKEA